MARSHMNPKGTAKPPVEFDADRKQRFLVLYARTGRLCQSARACNIHPSTVSDHRKRYPDFDEAVKLAKQEFNEALDEEIVRRGMEGWEEPVFYKGEEVSQIRKYSDVLLLAAAKRHDPAYRDKQQIDINHTGGVMVVPGREEDRAKWVERYGEDHSEEA